MTAEIEHGGNCCRYNKRQWFKCGACHRKICWCFGGDSELRSFVNLCNECWSHATKQAKLERLDVEEEARVVKQERDYRKNYYQTHGYYPL